MRTLKTGQNMSTHTPFEPAWAAESVEEGHPDKVADAIADALVDAWLERDPFARVAAEVLVKGNRVTVAGEIDSCERVDVAGAIRKAVARIGYLHPNEGFSAQALQVDDQLHRRTTHPGADVFQTGNAGAGDQALVYGYATDETEERLPLSLVLAHRLTHGLSQLRRGAGSDWMRPDGKALVTLRDGRLDGVVLAYCLAPEVELQDQEELKDLVQREVVEPALGSWMHDGVRAFLNPGGPFFEGGPAGDAGVTGRKLMVDTYGGLARHGGGGFSGKDGTKVDRSAAYFARWVARSIVDQGIARRAEVRLAYAIGREEPVVFAVDTLGTGDQEAAERFLGQTDPRPAAIIDQFQLRRPLYRATTQYGHFGKPELPWEQTGY